MSLALRNVAVSEFIPQRWRPMSLAAVLPAGCRGVTSVLEQHPGRAAEEEGGAAGGGCCWPANLN